MHSLAATASAPPLLLPLPSPSTVQVEALLQDLVSVRLQQVETQAADLDILEKLLDAEAAAIAGESADALAAAAVWWTDAH